MPIRLNDRLSQIASYINRGDSVCDIGTDHGFLPIYLAENDISDHIIMSDISRGSLDKAIADVREELGETGSISARLGDGLDVISKGECDDAVIAGMGGLLIIDILSWDISVTDTVKRFILQPRNNSGKLREWLKLSGFSIKDQTVVMENGHYCEIICCDTEGGLHDPGMAYVSKYEKDPELMAEYDYPDELRDPFEKGMEKKYFESELSKARRILESIMRNTDGAAARRGIIEKRIERLEKLCLEKNS